MSKSRVVIEDVPTIDNVEASPEAQMKISELLTMINTTLMGQPVLETMSALSLAVATGALLAAEDNPRKAREIVKNFTLMTLVNIDQIIEQMNDPQKGLN